MFDPNHKKLNQQTQDLNEDSDDPFRRSDLSDDSTDPLTRHIHKPQVKVGAMNLRRWCTDPDYYTKGVAARRRRRAEAVVAHGIRSAWRHGRQGRGLCAEWCGECGASRGSDFWGNRPATL